MENIQERLKKNVLHQSSKGGMVGASIGGKGGGETLGGGSDLLIKKGVRNAGVMRRSKKLSTEGEHWKQLRKKRKKR